MKPVITEQAEFDALDKEFRTYIERIRAAWLAKNRVDSKDVYEVMRPREREQVHHVIAEWGRYITPIAEAWWKERGYAVVWPVDDSEPMKARKLETT